MNELHGFFPPATEKRKKKRNSAFCVNSKIHMLQPGSTMKYKTGFDIEMTKAFSEKEKKKHKKYEFSTVSLVVER